MNRRQLLRNITGAGASLCVSTPLTTALALDSREDKTIVCRVIDEKSGQEVAARIRLLDALGREVVPLGHSETLAKETQEGDVRFQRRRFAYVDGRFRISSSSLPLKYQVLKGYEHKIAEGEINTGRVRDGLVTIPLLRWSSLSQKGWYSGDIHIHHIAPKTCRLEMDAEDLNVANILTSDFTADQDQFEGRINVHSTRKHLIYVNQEFRTHHHGHLCLLNLKRLIQPVKPMRSYDYPLLLPVCDEVRSQGGYVSWAHFPNGPGVESPLDVAMEKLDGLEILSTLEPREPSTSSEKHLIPELESNDGLRLWYRYLNCGFQLTAMAGTDKMSAFVTVGANRVFAQVEGEFRYQGWIDALKSGRTFITNSPLLSLTVNGKTPGHLIALESKKSKFLEIQALADSQLPYDRLEIVCNGQVIAEATPSGNLHHAEIRLQHPLSHSCWIAARAFEDLGRYRARRVDFTIEHAEEGTLLGDYYGTHRPETVFAHTSPVYVIRDGEAIRSWEDAQYYVRYLDRAIHWIETEAKFASATDKRASLDAFRAGRAIYQQRANHALGK